MNNLILFVIRYSAFLLFIFLETISLLLIVKYNQEQRSIFLNSSSIISGKLYNFADKAYEYNNLRSVADSLAQENAQLKADIFNLKRTLDHLPGIEQPADSCILEPYLIIPARVINNSIDQRNNHFTIDRGRNDGIRKGMGVISPSGIAGIIDETGDQFATAISILHSATRISASLKRTNYFGSLVWKEIDPSRMILEAIPRQADILIGDTVVTSGYSFIFPRGLFIGTVDKFRIEGGSNYYTVEVKLHENIARLDRVYVVEYKEQVTANQ